jgi:hypothetical protein
MFASSTRSTRWFSGNGRSFWTIDEGWDGTIADIDPTICELLS